nr:lanthionine synthetase LanC family protein [uncultured Macellibacteroides sp.]
MKTNQGLLLEEVNDIAYYLILKSNFYIEPGLYYGKTGIAIFFLHFYKYTKDKIFKEQGFRLLTEIQSLISANSLLNFDRGLSGIGAGVDYMCRNRLIKGNSNEVLEDFDRKIIEMIKNVNCSNLSIANGLCGIGKYLIYRKISQDRYLSCRYYDFNATINYVVDLIEDKIKNELLKYELDYLNPVWSDILSFLNELSQYDSSARYLELSSLLIHHKIKNRKRIKFLKFELEGRTVDSLGLFGGYAGRGLFLLQKIDKSAYNWKGLIS